MQPLTRLLLEGKFSALVWKAREMGLAELELYQDDKRNVLRPVPGATCMFASAGWFPRQTLNSCPVRAGESRAICYCLESLRHTCVSPYAAYKSCGWPLSILGQRFPSAAHIPSLRYSAQQMKNSTWLTTKNNEAVLFLGTKLKLGQLLDKTEHCVEINLVLSYFTVWQPFLDFQKGPFTED